MSMIRVDHPTEQVRRHSLKKSNMLFNKIMYNKKCVMFLPQCITYQILKEMLSG